MDGRADWAERTDMDRDHTFTNVFKKINHDQSLSELQHPGKETGRQGHQADWTESFKN